MAYRGDEIIKTIHHKHTIVFHTLLFNTFYIILYIPRCRGTGGLPSPTRTGGVPHVCASLGPPLPPPPGDEGAAADPGGAPRPRGRRVRRPGPLPKDEAPHTSGRAGVQSRSFCPSKLPHFPANNLFDRKARLPGGGVVKNGPGVTPDGRLAVSAAETVRAWRPRPDGRSVGHQSHRPMVVRR